MIKNKKICLYIYLCTQIILLASFYKLHQIQKSNLGDISQQIKMKNKKIMQLQNKYQSKSNLEKKILKQNKYNQIIKQLLPKQTLAISLIEALLPNMPKEIKLILAKYEYEKRSLILEGFTENYANIIKLNQMLASYFFTISIQSIKKDKNNLFKFSINAKDPTKSKYTLEPELDARKTRNQSLQEEPKRNENKTRNQSLRGGPKPTWQSPTQLQLG